MRGVFGSLVSSVLVVGCSSGPTRYGQLIDDQDQFDAEVCAACPDYYGAATASECLAAAESAGQTAAQEQCSIAVFEAHEGETDAYLRCTLPAYSALFSCLSDAARATCPVTVEARRPCDDAFSMARMACPSLPSAIEAELTACLTP